VTGKERVPWRTLWRGGYGARPWCVREGKEAMDGGAGAGAEQNDMSSLSGTVSAVEAALLLGRNESRIRSWVRDGIKTPEGTMWKLPAVRVGNTLAIAITRVRRSSQAFARVGVKIGVIPSLVWSVSLP
jgi:hypothetical protein